MPEACIQKEDISGVEALELCWDGLQVDPVGRLVDAVQPRRVLNLLHRVEACGHHGEREKQYFQ